MNFEKVKIRDTGSGIMHVDADLHIHSHHSMATGKSMILENIAKGARQKGVQLMGTGDCLHPGWLKEIRKLTRVDEGTFELNGIRFILTAEVEDMFRVHHLLAFPTLSSVEEAISELESREQNLTSDGRPKLRMTGEEIAELAVNVDALIGPCHAFTPWTSLYASHESLRGSYGDMEHVVSFLELGLSAESDYGDRIQELKNLTFLTNSDAHGPSPNRIAREFIRFQVEDTTSEEIRLAILRRKGRKSILNVGLPPQEGKYNETACIKCYTHFALDESIRFNWKCTNCGKRIKKGVRDRVEQLATSQKPLRPAHRPPFIPLIPLAEIISRAIGKGVNTKSVNRIWESLTNRFGSEIEILVDIPLEELEGTAEDIVIRAIKAFRTGEVRFLPGGGGKYGEIRLPWEAVEDIPRGPVQKGLMEFS